MSNTKKTKQSAPAKPARRSVKDVQADSRGKRKPAKSDATPDKATKKAKPAVVKKAIDTVKIKTSGPLDKRLSGLTAQKMRPAKYNPRIITDARLTKLDESIKTFGDLSGIVFNIRTGNLVSGHQRMKTIGKNPSKIHQEPHYDEHGTIAIGHVEVKSSKGALRIPYRAVDWHIKREKAANIAANAHGGNFDKDKLALVLADLDDVAEFDVEIVGLDPLTLKSLRLSKDSDGKLGPNHGATRNEFKEIGDDLETTHCCPKCGYKWG